LLKAKKVTKALIIELEKYKEGPLMITSGMKEEEETKVLSIKNEDEESMDKIFET
jgi:hypothetical protein